MEKKQVKIIDYKLSSFIRNHQLNIADDFEGKDISFVRTFAVDTFDENPRYLKDILQDFIDNNFEELIEKEITRNPDSKDFINDLVSKIDFYEVTDFEDASELMRILFEESVPLYIPVNDDDETKHLFQRQYFRPSLITIVGMEKDGQTYLDIFIIHETFISVLTKESIIDNISCVINSYIK